MFRIKKQISGYEASIKETEFKIEESKRELEEYVKPFEDIVSRPSFSFSENLLSDFSSPKVVTFSAKVSDEEEAEKRYDDFLKELD